GVGFIALFGVAVLNGIVLINHYEKMRKEHRGDVYKIVTDGTVELLRAVLLTGFVAAMGFIPMAISTSAGAEVQRPLATVVIGGLLLSTLLSLIIIPILYLLANTILKNIKA
ncbi:MAG: efflux RND transporter permease subunit, partial [Bacteroidales bacterium]